MSSKSKFRTIIDRVEGDLAVLELDSGNELIVPIFLLPQDLHDGMVLDFVVKHNEKEEKKLRDDIISLQNSLLSKE